jgi:cytochrome c oxidase subunit 4
MSEGTHDIKKEVRVYFLVFAALLVLSALTVGVSYVHFGVAMAVTVALIIATVKGSLVASFFMHLSHERKTIYGILLLTLVFFACMMALFIGAFHDPIFGTQHLDRAEGPGVSVKADAHSPAHGGGDVH